VLVYPHELAIGGSQLNAIDLAAKAAEHGHEVTVFGVPGPLVDYIAAKGLPFVAAHPLQYRPAPTRIWQLDRIARQRRIDVIHAYEWPPCLDAYYGAHLLRHVPLVCTVLSMSLVPLVPDSIPLVMGTRQLQESARPGRPGDVGLLEPPVDTDQDHPGIDGSDFRKFHGVADTELLAVIVSRLSIDLKLDSLVRAIDTVAELAPRLPIRLVIVGSGEAAEQLQRRAGAVNAAADREVVTMAGPTLDPRPAYAAADVVLGMGSSALRAMAFGKPLVVQGEKGFSLVLEPATMDSFTWQGFYGTGEGLADNRLLCSQLESLLSDPDRRLELGRFGRATVVERYSLATATVRLLAIYDQAVSAAGMARRQLLSEAARMAARAAGYEFRLHLPSEKRAKRVRETAELAAAAG